MERIPEIELIAVGVLGWLIQKARAPQHIPNWLGWVVVGVASIGLWFWMTPAALEAFTSDWRRALVSIVVLATAAQGAARAMSDTKMAPGTNSK